MFIPAFAEDIPALSQHCGSFSVTSRPRHCHNDLNGGHNLGPNVEPRPHHHRYGGQSVTALN